MERLEHALDTPLVQSRIRGLKIIEDLNLLGMSLQPLVHVQIRIVREAKEGFVPVARVSIGEGGEVVWQLGHYVCRFGHASDHCSRRWIHQRSRQEILDISFLAFFVEDAYEKRVHNSGHGMTRPT